MPLYVGMRNGWVRCAAAAASDVAALGFLYAVMAAAAGAPLWFRHAALARTAALAAIGFLAAVVIELRALQAGKWVYDAAMPRVPYMDVGASPVLQMVLIPLVLTWLSQAATRDGAHVSRG